MSYSVILTLITIYSSSFQSISTYTDLEWIVPFTPLMPTTTASQIIAYDNLNERIWLIGGSSTSNKLISYNISTNAFRQYDDIPYSIEGNGDSYTQINDTIYMYLYVSLFNEYIATFNVYNASFPPLLSTNTKIPRPVTNGVCITHQNNDFLFVLGGYDDLDSVSLDYFQIFNLNNQTWMNGPHMPHGRQSMTCIVSNDWLYAIGGADFVSITSIIKINVTGSIDNIVNQIWIQLNDTLRPQTNHLRSVLYQDDIFVIGDATKDFDTFSFMDIIHTKLNDQITYTNNTSPHGSIAAIIVNSTLYAFGGSNSNHSFQFVVLPTRKNIDCMGNGVCRDAEILVANEYEVNVYCSGYFACSSATFTIVNATNVNIYCLNSSTSYLECGWTHFILNNVQNANAYCEHDCRYIDLMVFNTADVDNTVTVLCDGGYSCSQGNFEYASPNTKIMHTCNELQSCRNALVSAIPSRSLSIDCVYGCVALSIYAPMIQIDSNFTMTFHHPNGSANAFHFIYHANAFAPNTNLNFVCSNAFAPDTVIGTVVHGVQFNKFAAVYCNQTHANVEYNNINFVYGNGLNYPVMNMLNNDTAQYNESYPTMIFYAKLYNAQNRKERFKPCSYFAEITLVCIDANSYVRSCHSSIFDFSEIQNATIATRNAVNITVYGPQHTFNSVQPRSNSQKNTFYFPQTKEVNFLSNLGGLFSGRPTNQVNIYIGNNTQRFYLECKYYDCVNSNVYFDINPFNYLLASDYKMDFQIWAGEYYNFANFTLYFSNHTQYDLSCNYNDTYQCPDYLLTLSPSSNPTRATSDPSSNPSSQPTPAPSRDCLPFTDTLDIAETLNYGSTAIGVSLGSFKMGHDVTITFDFGLFRGAFGDEILFWIENGDGVRPMQLNGGGSTMPLVLDFQGETNTVACIMNGDTVTYSIAIADNTVTFTRDGVVCGASITFTNSIVESSLIETRFDFHYGGFNDGNIDNLAIASSDQGCTQEPTQSPTKSPTAATRNPSVSPTKSPTLFPTISPTIEPTIEPTMLPTRSPTTPPTALPTIDPTTNPTETPQIAFTWIYSDISDPLQRIMITVRIEVNDHALNIDFNGFEWYIVDYNHSETFLIDPTQYSAITIYTIQINQDLYESVLVLPSLRTEYFGYGVSSNRRLMDSDPSFVLSPNTDYGFKVGMVDGLQSPAEEISTDPLIEEAYSDCTIINVENLIVFDDLLVNCSRQSEDGTLYYNLLSDNILLLPEFTNNLSELTSILPIGDMESVLLIRDANNVKTAHRLYIHFPNIHEILSESASTEPTELMDAAYRILNGTDITDTEISILYNFIVQMYDYNAVSVSEAYDFVDILYSLTMMQDNPVIMNQLSILVQLTSNADIIDSVNTLNTLTEGYLVELAHSISNDIDSEQLQFMVALCQELIINLEKLVSILAANSIADAKYINKMTETLIEYELYFAHIALLKSVPGERFRFDWNENDKFKHIDALRFMSGNVNNIYYDYNDEPQCGYDTESLQIPASFIAHNMGIFDCTFSTSSMNNYIESNRNYQRASNMVNVNIYNSNTSKIEPYSFNATNCSQYLVSLENSNSTLFDTDMNQYALGDEVAFPFCGFWDGVSSWIDHDCYVQSFNETVIVCSCLHLTSFQLSVDDFIPQANLLSKWNFRSVTTDNLIQYPTVWIVILSLLGFCIIICLLSNLNPRNKKQGKSTILAYQDVVFEAFKNEHISDDMIGVEIKYIDDTLSDHQQFLGGGLKQILSTNHGKKNMCLLQCKLYLLYLRNDHILWSAFQRTAGTNFSTMERFGCFYMYLCTIIVCTAIFYGVENKVTQDITASFLISLFGKLPVRMIKRCFMKSKPKQIEREIIVKEHEDYFKTKQNKTTDHDNGEMKEEQEEEGMNLNSPKLGDTMSVLTKHQLDTRQETVQKAIKRVKQSESMHHRLTLVEEIRLVLFDAVYPYSHYCKQVAWIILVIWTATCCVFAIIYGLQFDILSEIEKIEDYDNIYNDGTCWRNNQKLRIIDALSQSQVFDTRLDDYFAGIENITDSSAFLLNVALSLLLSIFVWQPLTTYVITWIKLWAFTWHLRLDFGFGVVKNLCLRCCGLDKRFKRGMQREYEAAADSSASVLVHGDRPLDVIGFFSNNALFLKTTKNAENDDDETEGMLQLAKTIPFGLTISNEKEDDATGSDATEQALLIHEDTGSEEEVSNRDESKSGYKSVDGDGESNYIQLQMADI